MNTASPHRLANPFRPRLLTRVVLLLIGLAWVAASGHAPSSAQAQASPAQPAPALALQPPGNANPFQPAASAPASNEDTPDDEAAPPEVDEDDARLERLLDEHQIVGEDDELGRGLHRAAVGMNQRIEFFRRMITGDQEEVDRLRLEGDPEAMTRGRADLIAYRSLVESAREELDRADRVAKLRLSTAPRAIADLPADSLALRQEQARLLELMYALDLRLAEEVQSLDLIRTEYQQSIQRAEAGGLTRDIGDLLRAQRAQLPDARVMRQQLRDTRRQISELGIQRLDIDRRFRELPRQREVLADQLERMDHAALNLDAGEVEQLVDEVRRRRRATIAALRPLLHLATELLQSIELARQATHEVSESYRQFIDERVLWIRSGPAIDGRFFRQLAEATAFLVMPDQWIAVGRDIYDDWRRSPGIWIMLVAAAALLLVARYWAQRKLRRLGEMSASERGQSYFLPMRVLGLTALVAMGYAAFPLLLGLRMRDIGTPDTISSALGYALVIFGVLLATLKFFLEACAERGLGHHHFGWPREPREAVSRNLRWLIWIMAPGIGIAAFLVGVEDQAHRHSLGRLAIMTVMGAMSIFAWRLLRGDGPIMATVNRANPNNVIARTHWFWFPASLVVPWAVVVFSALGYSYTASQLGGRMLQTVWMLLALLLVRALITRWLQITQWKLLVEETRRKREEEAARADAAQTASDGEGPILTTEAPALDAARINEQSQALVRTAIVTAVALALWWIWAGMFPALAHVANIQLWTYTGTIDGQPAALPITLVNLIWAMVLVAITVLVARNVPGILEILVSQAGMTPGSKYALSTVCRYIITAVGLVMAFNVIGVGWTNVQWLVAALSLGVGFGLQEIVANFVSGLILLFERPIRVGDVVQVGDAVGTVSKIRIRATTIVTWDRHELLVPNKEFITGRVTNWTLSDQVGRLLLKIGIAYGSNVEKAEEILLRVAKAHPRTLQEPGPMALFRGFGDNSLELELRFYVDGMDGRLLIMDEVLRNINKEFQEAGITIAFPQRDIHMDTLKPLDIRMVRDQARKTGPAAPNDKPNE
ncbi:MAG: mechanosensitive ion channel [Phycisphaeraceae bacterium]|nr:mechanosensitive ion channel [Phycisphaeraceae bacterium]